MFRMKGINGEFHLSHSKLQIRTNDWFVLVVVCDRVLTLMCL